MGRVNGFELLRQIRGLGLDAGGSVPVSRFANLRLIEIYTKKRFSYLEASGKIPLRTN